MLKFAILIPTLDERKNYLAVLFQHLQRQIEDRNVEIILNATGKELSIGKKREQMLMQTNADYIAFVDDDDMVSHDYIKRIYEAIQSEPDVVGMEGLITTDRMNPQTWSISTKYDWGENKDGFKYVRYPNHLAPIKRVHALEAGFPDKKFGEDYDYSMRLKANGKLSKEVYVAQNLYQYHYRTKK